jgi:dihydrofolate reductase
VGTHKLSSIDELKKVKAEEGPDIVLLGSSTLYPQLLDANLIDRFLLLTCPIVEKEKSSSAASRTP